MYKYPPKRKQVYACVYARRRAYARVLKGFFKKHQIFFMNEKLIEKKLREGVKKLKGEALKFFCMSFTGMPDRIVLMPGGRFWFVELKSTGKKPTPRQAVVHDWLRRLGFQVYVIDTQELLDGFLKLIVGEV